MSSIAGARSRGLGESRTRNKQVRVHRSIYGRSASKPHRAQHVLEQHLEEEYGGDAAEQQAHEIGVAKFIAEAKGVPSDEAGDGEEQPIDQRRACASPC